MRSKLLFATVLLAALSLPILSAAAELDAVEQEIVDWADQHAEAAIDLLEETVNIGSGTMNHDGVREVGRVMQRELDAAGNQACGNRHRPAFAAG